MIGILLLSAFPRIAHAITSCNATVSPGSVVPGSEAILQFDIVNTGSQPITWVHIGQPTPSYDINGITQGAWTDSTTNTQTTLTGSVINPGNTYSLQLAMATGPSEEPATDWQISTAPNSDGSGGTDCSGQKATSIANAVAPPSPNGESNVGLTYLSATTAIIGWFSDVPSTSYVYYGTDASYGKTATVPGQDNSHSVKLVNLRPNTVYHYKVAGSDGDGNNFFSADNTFVTPESPQTITVIVPGPSETKEPLSTSNVSAKVTLTIPPVPDDKTAPTISLIPFANKPYVRAPLISFSAADNGALARLDYSTDGGDNWLPADTIDGLGTKSASATFTPVLTQDGNYEVMVRAVDSNGNVTKAGPQTLVIDKLPPRFGNLAVTFGSQVLEPTTDGTIAIAVGGNYKLTGQAVGGAILVDIVAKGMNNEMKTFSLSQNQLTGLWGGALSFEKAGIYELKVRALDGAGNQTERLLGEISAVPAGRVVDSENREIANSVITAHYFEPSMQRWVVWDGAPYGQTNPQIVKNANYHMMVPAGKYYLEASASGHGTVLSKQFKVSAPQNLTASFTLPNRTLLHIGKYTLASPSYKTVSNTINQPLTILSKKNTIIGTKVVNFTLPRISKGTLQTVDLYGKPTILTLVNTWSPNSMDQLPALEAASKNGNIGVVPLFEGEDPSSVRAYLRLAGLQLDGIADPENSQVEGLTAGFGPKHIFIDRSGHIKKVMVGVLSEEEILQTLGGL